MEHLQFVTKKFDIFLVPTNNLLIHYFRDGPKPSIYNKLDERDRNLEDCKAVIRQVVDAKAKLA